MPETRDLLIEIGTEELPPKALCDLASAFEQGIRQGLEKAGFPIRRSGGSPPRAVWRR